MIDWLYVAVCAFVVPGIMLAFGWWFGTHPPKKINHFCGYRTRMSMKNMDTWVFAHEACGKTWVRWSKWAAVPGLMLLLTASGKQPERVESDGIFVLLIQLIILLVSLIPVEKTLRETFDEDGYRRK